MAHELGDVGKQTAEVFEGVAVADSSGPARRRYARPALTEFGTVHELTRGGTGQPGDAGQNRNPPKK